MPDLEKWVRKDYFEEILEGDKTVEVRSPDSKDSEYSDLGKGDTLMLKNEERGTAWFEVAVVAKYYSARKLLEEEGVENILPEVDSMKEAEREIHEIYESDRIDENGIYAIMLGELLCSESWPFLSLYEESAVPF